MTETIRAVGRTNARYVILFLIFIVTTFNYVDRATLSIAAPAMRKELGFDAVSMGLAFSAFGWAYTSMQIRAQTFRVLEMLTAMAVLYWLMGYPQAKLVDWIHKKYGVKE